MERPRDASAVARAPQTRCGWNASSIPLLTSGRLLKAGRLRQIRVEATLTLDCGRDRHDAVQQERRVAAPLRLSPSPHWHTWANLARRGKAEPRGASLRMKARLAALLEIPAQAAAILVAAGAFVSLVGWAIGSPAMQALFPGATPVQAASAVCFLFLSISLCFVRPHEEGFWHRWGPGARWIPALAVAAYAGMRVGAAFQDIGSRTNVPLVGSGLAGMATSSAICFTLLGVAFLAFDGSKGAR